MSDLGKPLEILDSGLGFKQYPCCGGVASVVDNLISLKQQRNIAPAMVKEIECQVHPNRITYLDRAGAGEGLEAKFSIQYCAATALLDGKLALNHFLEESVQRPETRALMKKVRITPREDLGGFGSEVIVRTVDGDRFSSVQTEFKGSAALPLSEREILAKFVDCAKIRLSPARAEQAGQAFMSLEEAPDLDAVGKLLATNS